MLVELSVMEQPYQAVLAVVRDGWTMTAVAEQWGVSRQSVHAWLARYRDGGLEALADRSHRPKRCPHQVALGIEAQICELRGRQFASTRVRTRQGRRGGGAEPLGDESLVGPERADRTESTAGMTAST
jgi:hypothetical protein